MNERGVALLKHDREKQPSDLWRMAGLGKEFVGAVVGFLLLGRWLDSRYEINPWGTVICLSLGVVGGLWNMIRRSIRATYGNDLTSRSSSDDQKGRDS